MSQHRLQIPVGFPIADKDDSLQDCGVSIHDFGDNIQELARKATTIKGSHWYHKPPASIVLEGPSATNAEALVLAIYVYTCGPIETDEMIAYVELTENQLQQLQIAVNTMCSFLAIGE